jgi:hypothetical protein
MEITIKNKVPAGMFSSLLLLRRQKAKGHFILAQNCWDNDADFEWENYVF